MYSFDAVNWVTHLYWLLKTCTGNNKCNPDLCAASESWGMIRSSTSLINDLSHLFLSSSQLSKITVSLSYVSGAGCICSNAQAGSLSAIQESSTLQWTAWKHLYCMFNILYLSQSYSVYLPFQILQLL